MGALAKKLESEVAAWPSVSAGAHQFVAREFRYGKGEIGHVHMWGDVDIPFPRAMHDALLADGRAQQHRWLPDSGWVTFHMHNEADLGSATWLLRLSYLRYALKDASEPESLLQEETERLKLSPALAALIAQFVPRAFRGERATAV
jgi:hypothetical protein